MAVYDLQEQEQLDDLKAWWSRWGNYVTAAVLAVCIAIVAVQGWRWWKHRQSDQASTLYAAVMSGARANDLAKARDAAMQLQERYSGTVHAPSAALIVARLAYDKGDKVAARAQLTWALEHADDDMKQVARYRLAELQFDEKQYDDALRTLDAKHDPSFEGLYADLRGDILAAAGRNAEARAAYELAVAKLDPKSPYRAYVQVKLDAAGGPAEPIAAATGASASGASTATAPAPATSTPAAPVSAPPAPVPASTAPAK